MSMMHRGKRQQLTVRLPYDEYREVAIRARARGWSMSDYAGWCIAKELSGKAGRKPHDPLGFTMPHPPLTETRDGNRAEHVPIRDFGDG
jgi:hypothetical protein